MSKDVLIGIDAGTSVIKAVAFSADGEALASSNRPNHYASVEHGGVEQAMTRTWRDTLAVLAELTGAHPELARRTVALAVTGQGDGTWLVDADGEPVHDAWLWLDARSAKQAEAIEGGAHYDTVYRETGTAVNVCQMRSQLRWMASHAPELLDAAASAFHCKDFLYQRLTGERAADPSEAVFTFGSLASRDYSDAVIDALELADQRHLLPPIVDGMAQSHALLPAVAREVGLPDGLPVTLGYVDVMCSALGGGLFDPDVAPGLSIVGSTGMHMKWVADADAIRLNASRSGYTMCFPGGSYAQMQSNMAATLNIDWLLQVATDAVALAGHETSPDALLAKLDDALAATTPSAVLFHPYISQAGERGPFTDPDARASFSGLDQSAGFAELLRSVYDGLALAARDCFAAMGEMPAEIRISGGATRSLEFRKLLAGALGTPLRIVDRDEAGAAGACMIAATRHGLFDDLAACSDRWIGERLGEPLEPDPTLQAHFDALLPVYQATREALTPGWQALAEIRREQVHEKGSRHD